MTDSEELCSVAEVVANNENKSLYFALDSDVLTNLAELYQLREMYAECDVSALRAKLDPNRHRSLNANFKFYNVILDEIIAGNIKALVTPTPYYESRQLQWCLDFMKKFCYLPNINMTNYRNWKYRVRKLAKAYCEPYVKDGKKHLAPLITKYSSYVGDIVPSNDAYVMAEATLCNACLLTENVKDLIERKNKYSEHNALPPVDYRRDWGIGNVNVNMGYCEDYVNKNGEIKKFSPIPVTIGDVGKIFAYHRAGAFIYPKSRDSAFVRAEDVEERIDTR